MLKVTLSCGCVVIETSGGGTLLCCPPHEAARKAAKEAAMLPGTTREIQAWRLLKQRYEKGKEKPASKGPGSKL